MVSQLYKFLSGIGYHHPLHPALTHLPVGLTIAGFIFIAMSIFLKRPNFAQREKMPVSGWPVSPESVRRQLKTPFNQMPPFGSLNNEETSTLTDYLKSL